MDRAAIAFLISDLPRDQWPQCDPSRLTLSPPNHARPGIAFGTTGDLIIVRRHRHPLKRFQLLARLREPSIVHRHRW
jgi:hypothetical protein